MGPEAHRRKLAAVLAADVVAYTRMMGADEDSTMDSWWSHRKEVIDPEISRNRGRIVKHTGDGFLAQFDSIMDAVCCAVSIQSDLARRNKFVAADKRMDFRMGINLCDIMVDDEDIYGDGVNIAARLEALAAPGGLVISASVFEQIRGKLDLAWEDMGDQQVKNIAKPVRAFRFSGDGGVSAAPQPEVKAKAKTGNAGLIGALAAVVLVAAGAIGWLVYDRTQVPAETVSAGDAGNIASGMLNNPLPEAPSIAVLPFDNMSGDPQQEYFSDGITEDLITDLSRISGLFVIARNSVFTYKGKAVDIRQVARELGVNHILEGSVRKSGNRVRINVQLIDANTGRHLWAERFDRDLVDVFALQDEVTQRIVSALAVKLTKTEEQRLSGVADANPEAYDMLLRGLEQLRRFTRETNAEARKYFEKAVALDPGYVRALADVALTLSLDVEFGWTDDAQGDLARGLEILKKAEALDDRLRQVYFSKSALYRYMKRYEDSVAAAKRSLEIDPNYADGYAQLANTLVSAGRHEESITAIRQAMRLSPRHAYFYIWILGHAYFHLERYEEAVVEFKKVLQKNPEFELARRALAAAYGHLGREDDAAWEREEVLVVEPGFTLARARQISFYKRESDLDRYIEGLRKAGFPE